ncbi:hypothetical protein BJ138DRAFT_1236291, partial [Hygrophoropsis aurantiaca]
TNMPRRTQGLTRTRERQKLSKEARAEVSVRRQEAAEKFKTDLDDAWGEINKVTENIAASNGKSIRHVQQQLHMGRALAHKRRTKMSDWNAFCWKRRKENINTRKYGTGKGVLPSLTQDLSKEYASLTREEKDVITAEYTEYKMTKTLGRRISTKSKINDVAQTMKVLNSLNSRTGVQSLAFITRGTTDLPLRGMSFATAGVDKFMSTTMNIDPQDFVSRMEGFSVQGIKGAAKNHAQRVSEVRGLIRSKMQNALRDVSGMPRATMSWKYHFTNVVERYKVKLVGWPDNVPFTNLSEASSAIHVLESLHRKLESGVIHWESIDDGELACLRNEYNQKIANGEITEPSRCTRSDKNKKRTRKEGANTGASRATYKSKEFIHDDDNDDSDSD